MCRLNPKSGYIIGSFDTMDPTHQCVEIYYALLIFYLVLNTVCIRLTIQGISKLMCAFYRVKCEDEYKMHVKKNVLFYFK